MTKAPCTARTDATQRVLPQPPVFAVAPMIQRACSCGAAAGAGGTCAACARDDRFGVQAKLGIGRPGDRYEREADALADRMLAPTPLPTTGPLPVTPLVQRQVEEDEEEEMLQPKSATSDNGAALLQRQVEEEEEEEEMLQPKPAATASPARARVAAAGAARHAARAVSSGGGHALPAATRAFFEPRLGRDLGAVRVHTGASAARAAQAIRARAYTYRSHIAFAPGEFAPDSTRGRRLLAHELVHTVQQAPGAPAVQREIADAGPPAAGAADTGPTDAGPVAGPGGPPVPEPPRVCGPHVETAIATVWRKIQTDFTSSRWSLNDRRNACLYLITPFVPASAVAPAGPVRPNRDAFDTLGLYQDGAEWQRRAPFHPPCGVPGSLNPAADNFDAAHENGGTCSNTVTTRNGCWLMGTVNYGTFGVMMKLCHDHMGSTPGAWFGVRLENFIRRGATQPAQEGETESNIQRIARAARPYMQWATLAAQIVGSPALFSDAALSTLVSVYKTIDGETDVLSPLKWARATYNGGPTAVPSGTNRTRCPTTCSLTYNCNPFDYVWEPKKRRGTTAWAAGCASAGTPPTYAPPTREQRS